MNLCSRAALGCSFLLLAAASIGCGGAPPEGAAPSHGPAPTPREPIPANTANADAVPIALVSAVAPPMKKESPFSVALVADTDSFAVFQIPGLTTIDLDPMTSEPKRFVVEDARIREAPELSRGRQSSVTIFGTKLDVTWFMTMSIEGKWPDAAVLHASAMSRDITSRDFRWKGDRWATITPPKQKGPPLSPEYEIGAQRDTELLATDWQGGTLWLQDWATPPVLRVEGAARAKPPRWRDVVMPVTLAASEDGAVFLAGGKRLVFEGEARADDALVVEIVAPGDVDGKTVELPASARAWRGVSKAQYMFVPPSIALAEMAIVAVSGREAYVAANLPSRTGDPKASSEGYIARWDGTAFTQLGVPDEPLERFTTEVTRAALWRGDTGLLLRRGGFIYWKTATGVFRVAVAGNGVIERLSPPGKKVDFISFDPEGRLFASLDGAICRREDDGSFTELALPEIARAPSAEGPPRPARLVWRTKDDLLAFVVSDGKSSSGGKLTVLRTAPSGSGPVAAGASTAARSALVTPATPSCSQPFVVLYHVSRVAPPDYDFPATREALKGRTDLAGIRFAETLDLGRRYLVGFAPTFALGKRLADVIAEKIPSARPQLLCGKPAQEVRQVRWDLATGNVKK